MTPKIIITSLIGRVSSNQPIAGMPIISLTPSSKPIEGNGVLMRPPSGRRKMNASSSAYSSRWRWEGGVPSVRLSASCCSPV